MTKRKRLFDGACERANDLTRTTGEPHCVIATSSVPLVRPLSESAGMRIICIFSRAPEVGPWPAI